MSYFKVTFHLDGSGVAIDPREPTHLDALLAWCLAACQGLRHPQRDEPVEDVRLPLVRRHFPGYGWCWRASALFPEGPSGESLVHWRSRFRHHRATYSQGSPNLTNGPYRDWNMPLHMLLCHRMVAYGSGNLKQVRKLLTRELRYLGRKRAHGHGRILRIEVERMEEDWSLVRDGRAQRWLPDPRGTRLVRLRPPYWNRTNRMRCCEVGDPWSWREVGP